MVSIKNPYHTLHFRRRCGIIGRVMKMDTKKEWPQRKHPRLKHYDYGSAGAYFITMCTQDRKCILSRVVGRGLAPAVTNHIEYTLWGEIAEQQLFSLKDRFPSVTVRRYVIMPNHIHVILILGNETAGASPRPTVMDVICAYKSLTAQECKKNGFVGKLFQTSFHDHVIRSRRDYEEISQYMQDNPRLWREDCFYTEA